MNGNVTLESRRNTKTKRGVKPKISWKVHVSRETGIGLAYPFRCAEVKITSTTKCVAASCDWEGSKLCTLIGSHPSLVDILLYQCVRGMDWNAAACSVQPAVFLELSVPPLLVRRMAGASCLSSLPYLLPLTGASQLILHTRPPSVLETPVYKRKSGCTEIIAHAETCIQFY